MKILVHDVVENNDGTADLNISYDKEVADLIRSHYNRKRISKKLVEKFVIEGLTNYIEQDKL